MKTIKSLMLLVALFLVTLSCSDDTDGPMPIAENPLEAYNLAGSFEANGHKLELYTEKDRLTTGYNELLLQIEDLSTGKYIPNASITWSPIMHMAQMSHSCPKSAIVVTEKDTVYKGYLVFQMASNADEYWELNLEYHFGGNTYTISEQIEVNAPTDGKRTVNVFTGSDHNRYVLAMVPFRPEVATNDFSAALFKMESMMDFSLVEDHTIALDPRMPGMGNHSSPNNEDLTYDAVTDSYLGKLSLTMTGYWKINLQLFNTDGNLVKGEEVTEENEHSSLYFEIEF